MQDFFTTQRKKIPEVTKKTNSPQANANKVAVEKTEKVGIEGVNIDKKLKDADNHYYEPGESHD